MTGSNVALPNPAPAAGRPGTSEIVPAVLGRAAAALIAVATSALIGWLLFRPTTVAPRSPELLLVLIQSPYVAESTPAGRAPYAPRAPVSPPRSSGRPSAHRVPIVPARADRSPESGGGARMPSRNAASAFSDIGQHRLYKGDGRVILPAGTAIDPLKPAPRSPGDPDDRARRYTEKLRSHDDPMDYRPARFDKYWQQSEAGGALAKRIGAASRRTADVLYGEDIQQAIARPPPQAPFKPHLHENPSDLSSEEAYKTVSISDEPIPGFDGEASRRVREAKAAIHRIYAGCGKAVVDLRLKPLHKHAIDLENIEFALAYAAGSAAERDKSRRAAQTAYDESRRAIAYADRELSACAK
ncbi:hypothetical protein [Lysobacter firmicutimachus]|uniref:Uncharacterized protein n=1 Tax=Lysobacter firmicutimachus TaxID=1792846 RepID=A0ABU8CXI8_9GAMM